MHDGTIKDHLDNAAKAVGAKAAYGGHLLDGECWYPLEDGQDALKLAVMLGIAINVDHSNHQTVASCGGYEVVVDHNDDAFCATNMAIVCVASMIGCATTSTKHVLSPTASTVIQLVSQVLGVPGCDITPTSHFVLDLGMDDVDIIEVVIAVEDEYEIVLEDDDVDGVHTVDDLVRLVEAARTTQ